MEGKIDRRRLLDIQGRGRKRQMELADKYQLTGYAKPAGGCLLTDPGFAKRLRDLFAHANGLEIRDLELLKVGRHLRLNDKTKIIVGRKKMENVAIRALSQDHDTMIEVRDFPGPTVLVPYGCKKVDLQLAAGICVLYSDAPGDVKTAVDCCTGGRVSHVDILPAEKEVVQRLLI
ncbi:MAG: tRNA 4-thiouridine(8) synthase ThiI, partial [Deltaproteobacteria bacterium]|nr:tRNA 4-thiouridine(8) synthase ThiI [Deltaproteobacteria bacterium]